MKKILLEIYLPMDGTKHDLWVPGDIGIQQLTACLETMFHERNHNGSDSERLLLCDKVTGRPLDINSSATAQDLCNGAHLMLI